MLFPESRIPNPRLNPESFSVPELTAVDANLVLLPGDGIGPEVVAQAERVLEVVAEKIGHHFGTRQLPMGGNAIDSHGDPLPEETLSACRQADAILLGAVGGPKWDDPRAKTRP